VLLIKCSLPTSTQDAPKQDFWIAHAATTTFHQQHTFNHKRSIKAPWSWCRNTETCRSIFNNLLFNVYELLLVQINNKYGALVVRPLNRGCGSLLCQQWQSLSERHRLVLRSYVADGSETSDFIRDDVSRDIFSHKRHILMGRVIPNYLVLTVKSDTCILKKNWHEFWYLTNKWQFKEKALPLEL
jgi:hypothetical protein